MKKSLSNKISNKFINETYDLAKKNGAHGGKLSGAGGGGFLSFIAQKKSKNKLINSILKKNLIYFPINMDSTGSIILTKTKMKKKTFNNRLWGIFRKLFNTIYLKK